MNESEISIRHFIGGPQMNDLTQDYIRNKAKITRASGFLLTV